ncbi:acyl-CoA N-acyltransferase [Hyaloraphidium curvatum]|nr:acyl-CoA N-acyltransferase [Hyaloraphidium curvatum]
MPSAASSFVKARPLLAEGSWHYVEWRQSLVRAQILDVRGGAGGAGVEYYIHYANCDRRLDEWVPEDRVDPKAIAAVAEDVAGFPPLPAPSASPAPPADAPPPPAAPAAAAPARPLSDTANEPFGGGRRADKRRAPPDDDFPAKRARRSPRGPHTAHAELWTDDDDEPDARGRGRSGRRRRSPSPEPDPLGGGDAAGGEEGPAARTRTRAPELPTVHEIIAAAADARRALLRARRHQPPPTPPRPASAPPAPAPAKEAAPPNIPASPPKPPKLTAAERRRLEYRNRPRPVVLSIPRAASVIGPQVAEVRPHEIKEVITGLFAGNVVLDREREKEREESTKVKGIEVVQFGAYEVNTWYFSPYPEEYRNLRKLFVCDLCLRYCKQPDTFVKHVRTCRQHRPPGRRVYAKDRLRIYEIDGKVDKLYAQNLCLVGKLFLDHKTVNYDIDSFYFYVLVEADVGKKGGGPERVLGYFSKEKASAEGYNLACIIVFPQHQRRGLGRMLIEFSYELSKLEGVTGTPERPLSDLGLRGYRAFWEGEILNCLRTWDAAQPRTRRGRRPSSDSRLEPPAEGNLVAGLPTDRPLTLRSISLATGIKHEDVVATLAGLGLLKYWTGPEGVGSEVLVARDAVREYLAHRPGVQRARMVDPELVTWTDPNTGVGSGEE